ncbi:MAG TPA: HAD family hydrolase [Terriglobia bacterium]|nr:HAD family hydrolase [Terriglobia bacterium]
MGFTYDNSRADYSRIRLLVFDLDGTLIDSKDDLVHSVNAVRQRLGRDPLPEETVASYVGRGVVVLMRSALGETASEAEVAQAIEFFLEYYRDHMLDHTVAYPGVREALEELKARPMAVLTNKPVKFSQAILAGLGLDRYFTQVYGGNSFAQKKPDPVGILALMREANMKAEHTMMVGDSDTDVLTGKNAGVWTCGVTYGLAPETLKTSPPDFLLDDMRELPKLLENHHISAHFSTPEKTKSGG